VPTYYTYYYTRIENSAANLTLRAAIGTTADGVGVVDCLLEHARNNRQHTGVSGWGVRTVTSH
jgi:hypothetical protein